MESNDESLLKVLTVETLRVYNFMLSRHPSQVTLAELSNHLGLTKPTVLHHIEKLKLSELIEPTLNGYQIKEFVKIAVIKGYTNRIHKLMTMWLPIIVLFAVLLGVSVILIPSIELKAICAFFSSIGIILAVYEMQKL